MLNRKLFNNLLDGRFAQEKLREEMQMIKIQDFSAKIKTELNTIIKNYNSEHKELNSIGIYSCPSSGWISLCFNKNKTIDDCGNNCPDFEFVEYGIIQIPEWEEEYNLEKIEIKENAFKTFRPNIEEEGDDAYNQIFFEYLKKIAKEELYSKYKNKILVQMLDSQYCEII
jgi:hypothetical protein